MGLPMRVLTALRSGIYLAYLVLTVIPYATMVLCCSWLPQTQRYWLTIGWPSLATWGARWICGLRWRVEGWDNLPQGP
ncbi:MAG TPA: 1-acyl-sn-glycerol-3-phosphate acyltransferase, partial [Burkholderiaceae bacterium]|nr:1-acyl-sn-glycerol-3-phosphate acyltransferase [Burkholderiaceae bacterium]